MPTPCVNHFTHRVLNVNSFTAHKYAVCLIRRWNLVEDNDANTMCQPLYAPGVTCEHLCSTPYTLYAWSNAGILPTTLTTLLEGCLFGTYAHQASSCNALH